MNRCMVFVVPMLLLLMLIAGAQGQAGPDKGSPWKVVLPPDVFKELTQRSIKTIEDTSKANPKVAAERIAVESAILVAYTMSVKDVMSDDVASVRGAALQAMAAARKKDVKGLASFGASVKSAPKAPAGLKDSKLGLADAVDLMEIFKKKTSGGEGIHDDLKYQPKLEKLNGIEALIGSLSSKKLSDANLAKVSKELPLLAYRIAVVGSLTHELAPKKDTKWRAYADTMRDASVAMAAAAQKKDGAGVLKAADVLQNSCTDCHRDFKK